MTGRRNVATFANLARLQGLAAMREHEAHAVACDKTNVRLTESESAIGSLASASSRVDAIFAGQDLCLERLSIAARKLILCDVEVERARVALDQAYMVEETARSACRQASNRLAWTERRVGQLRRERRSKDEEKALRETTGLYVLRERMP